MEQAQRDRDKPANERARREVLRIDGARSLGENLEQADALIKAAFELARGHVERAQSHPRSTSAGCCGGWPKHASTTLDIMRWVPGIDADRAYAILAEDADVAEAFGIRIHMCSPARLRAMKRAAGRPQDLQDLADLDAAHPGQ